MVGSGMIFQGLGRNLGNGANVTFSGGVEETLKALFLRFFQWNWRTFRREYQQRRFRVKPRFLKTAFKVDFGTVPTNGGVER
jgi:hypothetical protein